MMSCYKLLKPITVDSLCLFRTGRAECNSLRHSSFFMLNFLTFPFTVFVTGTFDGFKGAVNHWLLPGVVFFTILGDAGACWVVKAIYKQFNFSHFGMFFWF